jgi:hypothetical protein
MVVSAPRSLDAFRSRDTPRLALLPDVSGILLVAGNFVVLCNLNSILVRAPSLALDVLGFLSVEVAELFVRSQDGKVPPGGRGPVRIVVSLLSALISVSVTVVVLSGEDGRGSASVQVTLVLSVGNEETHVPLSGLAGSVVHPVLVHAEGEFASGGISCNGAVGIIGNGAGGRTISHQNSGISIRVAAHVLDHHVANQLAVDTATVLVCPLNRQE